jgi:hypothetical protein
MASKGRSKRASRKQSPDATELLVMELQQIHSAESQLGRVLPRADEDCGIGHAAGQATGAPAGRWQIVQDVEKALDELEESPGLGSSGRCG